MIAMTFDRFPTLVKRSSPTTICFITFQRYRLKRIWTALKRIEKMYQLRPVIRRIRRQVCKAKVQAENRSNEEGYAQR